MKPVRIRPRADAEIDALADTIAADSPTAALRFFIVPTLRRSSLYINPAEPEMPSYRHGCRYPGHGW